MLRAVLAAVPDSFLLQAAGQSAAALADPALHRQAYVQYFQARLAERGRWLQGAIDARG